MATAINCRCGESGDTVVGVQSCEAATRPQIAVFLVAAAALWFSLLTPAAAQTCCGDCDSDGHVMVDELMTCVNIALGASAMDACVPGDTNGDQQVTIDELLAAVNNALSGCPLPPGLVRYWIGAIPDQVAWHNGRIQFLVSAPDMPSASFAVETNPQPGGTISLEPVAGSDYWLFQHVPAATDKADFTVTIVASVDGRTMSQSFVISSQPILPPEQTVFGTAGHTPPPITTYETETFERKSLVPENFNGENLETYRVQIIGETVEIEAKHANGPNGLYEAYFDGNRRDIREMEIIGETVVFRSPARLKQTDVTIYARELRFEGDGQLKTTPAEILTSPGQNNGTGIDGKAGLKAGDVTLNIGSFYTGTPKPDIDLTGGGGQPGGPGQHGTDGYSAGNWWNGTSCADSFPCEMYLDDGILYAPAGECITYGECGENSYGVATWPTNGTRAFPSGKPGQGGVGGRLVSNYDVFGFFTIDGGASAPGTYPTAWPTTYWKGGYAGTPTMAIHADCYWDTWNACVSCTRYANPNGMPTVAGQSFNVPLADSPFGLAGTYTQEGSPNAWLRPQLLRKILNHIRDDYLGERVAEAEARLREYVSVLDDYRADSSWGALDPMIRFELEQMYDEMQALLQQIENNLDYFGNPAGWVPMLSFEVNKVIFDQEIERAMRMLYLAYWIRNKESTGAGKAAALVAAREQLRAEIGQAKLDYDDAVAAVPNLKNKAQALATKIHETQDLLVARENELLQQTEDPPWLACVRGALKGAAMACQMIPVYQPALGAVGGGLRLMSNIDPDKPWASIFDAGDITSAFQNSAFDSAATSQKAAKDGIDPGKVESKSFDYLGALRTASAGLTAGIADIRGYLEQRKAPSPEMLAELERLKSMDPEFKELADKVEALLQEKREFTDELVGTMQQVVTLSDLITRNMLAIDAMNREATPGLLVMDGRASSYLDDMERRAYDRLVKYHYYMAKAYEYRLLKPYTKPLDLKPLLDRFKDIADANSDHEITPAQFDTFKALYQDLVASVAEEIFDDYNSNRPELSVPIRFALTPEEISRLNQGEVVNLNLFNEGFFLSTEENVRIYDFKVFDINTQPVGGSYGRVASVDVTIDHTGISNFKSDGAIYQFRHYNTMTENPIVWGARYDPVNDIIDPFKPSAASDSLLCSLLNSCADLDHMMLYSRPSAWADLHVSRVVRDSTGRGIDITSLTLELVFDFTRRNDTLGRKDLEIVVTTATPEGQSSIVLEEANFQPYFVFDRPDFNGRQDARGRVIRIYPSSSQPLQVRAEEVYGAWKFDKWTDRLGGDLPGGPFDSPAISLTVQNDRTICAQYVPTAAPTTASAASATQQPVTTIFSRATRAEYLRGRREIQGPER
jgi:hypothetical protein